MRDMLEEKTHVYTVTELTKGIKRIIEGTFGEVWVEGEISNFKMSSAGHAYFSIKDAGSVLNCALFKGAVIKIKFNIEDGMQVLCRGNVTVYEKRGQYQLIVKSVEPCGRGALQLAFEQLKEKLNKEGLFREEHKKALPALPIKIGVVTSPTGAAVRDILKVARRRFKNVEITIRPVRVQGDEAAEEIACAIEELNEYNHCIGEEENPVDVIIVGRGGGSLEELWPFNEEIVARAIYASEIPIISAVGHEVDFTISDFVADARAATPSAAAETIMPKKNDLLLRINDLTYRMSQAVNGTIETLETRIENLRSSYVLKNPMNVFLHLDETVDDLLKTATSKIKHFLQLENARLGSIAGKLNVMSPLAVLERGYSITFKDNVPVKDVKQLKKGDTLHTSLAKGIVISKVEEIKRSS